MKKIFSYFTVLLLSGGSLFADDVNITQNFVDYHLKDNKYVVIYVETEDTPPEAAKSYALRRAAEVAKNNGYRYFIVDSQKEVMIAATPGGQGPMPSNMYQELIIERNFGKQPYESQVKEPANMYPGLKLSISGYKERPQGDAIDVCSLVPCK